MPLSRRTSDKRPVDGSGLWTGGDAQVFLCRSEKVLDPQQVLLCEEFIGHMEHLFHSVHGMSRGTISRTTHRARGTAEDSAEDECENV